MRVKVTDTQPSSHPFVELRFEGPQSVEKQVCSALGVNSIRNLGTLEGKRVFLRVDANVSPDAKHLDQHPRVKQIAAVVGQLLQANCKVLISTHRSGSSGESISDRSAESVFKSLQREVSALENQATFIKLRPSEISQGKVREGRYFTRVFRAFEQLPNGQALFIENVRLFPSEKSLSFNTARLKAAFDLVVNDGFGVGHRADQFSVDGIPQIFAKHKKALGPGAIAEWGKLLEFVNGAKDRSIGLVLGGDHEKFGTKLLLLGRILESQKIGLVYLGGLFGTTFLAANGAKLGKTPISSDQIHQNKLNELVRKFPEVRFLVPDGYRGIGSNQQPREWQTVLTGGRGNLRLADNDVALDQYPFRPEIEFSRAGITRVLGVGPLGYYKKDPFGFGTSESYKALSTWVKKDAARMAIFGGGNSLEHLLKEREFHGDEGSGIWLSSGGGALLDGLDQALRYVDKGEQISTPAILALR